MTLSTFARAALAATLVSASAAHAFGGPAAPTAETLLRKVLQGPSAAFVGHQRSELVLASGRVVASVEVVADGHGRTRRTITSGAAAGVVVLQAGRSVWQRGADSRWTRLPDLPEDGRPVETAAAILRNYAVHVGAAERVAGRLAIPLRISHRRPYNPSRNLWLDPGAGIVLKDVLFAPDGRMRSASEFVDIRLGAQPADRFKPPATAQAAPSFGPASFAVRASASAVERESGRPVLLPKYVPEGYRLVLYGIMHTGSGRLMPAIRYSDGLAAFTIFQRGAGSSGRPGPGFGRPGFGGPGRGRGWRGGRGAAGDAPRCVGQSDIQSAVVLVSGARSNYLLVGDLSETELKRVAESLP
jgi:hypothetical protein